MTEQDITALLDRLEETMRRIAYVFYDLDDEEYEKPIKAGEWSAIEIFAHLKAADDIVPPRIPMIMTRNNPHFPNVDERLWAQMAGYDITPVVDTLATYQRHRAEMVGQLRRMPLEAWSRIGTHETNGEKTLFKMLTDFADHEAEHAAELEKILAHYQAQDAQS